LPAPNSKQAITARKATAARNLGTTGAEIAAAMAAKGRTELEVGADGVAVITICNPPVNSLSIDVLYSLKESYEEALRRNDVKAIVVTGIAQFILLRNTCATF